MRPELLIAQVEVPPGAFGEGLQVPRFWAILPAGQFFLLGVPEKVAPHHRVRFCPAFTPEAVQSDPVLRDDDPFSSAPTVTSRDEASQEAAAEAVIAQMESEEQEVLWARREVNTHTSH